MQRHAMAALDLQVEVMDRRHPVVSDRGVLDLER